MTSMQTTLHSPRSPRHPRLRLGAILTAETGVAVGVAAAIAVTDGDTTRRTTTPDTTPPATVETVQTVGSVRADPHIFDPAAGIQPRAQTSTSLFDPAAGLQLNYIAIRAPVSGSTSVMDPATGLPAGAVWTADPASGFSLAPAAPKTVPTVSGSTSLFDPAAGFTV